MNMVEDSLIHHTNKCLSHTVQSIKATIHVFQHHMIENFETNKWLEICQHGFDTAMHKFTCMGVGNTKHINHK